MEYEEREKDEGFPLTPEDESSCTMEHGRDLRAETRGERCDRRWKTEVMKWREERLVEIFEVLGFEEMERLVINFVAVTCRNARVI